MAKKKETAIDPLSLILNKLNGIETRLTQLEEKDSLYTTEEKNLDPSTPKQVEHTQTQQLTTGEPTQEEIDKWLPLFQREGIEFARRYREQGSDAQAARVIGSAKSPYQIASNETLNREESQALNIGKVPEHLERLRRKTINDIVSREVIKDF